MRNILFLILVLAFIGSAVSNAANVDKKGLLVKSDFQFKSSKTSFQVKQNMIFAEDNTGWTALGPAQAGVALLGKLHKPEKGVVQMEFMVVDTNLNPVALNQMSLVSELGKGSSISTESRGEKVTVGVVIEPTKYTEKSKSN